ncbi:MAG: hypothetical protein IPK63_05845 [Candidatus Competibacteraceae bacterium]|nr:hypothetical protein [Candidatus Competibacteraceae bacterium]
MNPDQDALGRLRVEAQQARADGHFAQAARFERQVVALASASGLVGERTRALLWEGYSLRQAGEDDLALTALLQAANERAATADPADVFSALVAIIHISLDRKTAAFCRTLLEQGRRYLAEIGQPWTALLDYLEGELAYRRGDFRTAWDWHCRAWADWRDQYPRLTAATHLWALCRTAFRRHDLATLEQLVEQLTVLRPSQRLERPLAQRAQLLQWRARRAAAGSCPTPSSHFKPAETAQALLVQTAERFGRDIGTRHEALRVLALLGCWAEVEAALSRFPLKGDDFESALLLGDLAVSRARLAQGLPTLDEDWNEALAGVSPFSPDREACYQAVKEIAEQQDARFDTQWYSHAVEWRCLSHAEV